MQQRQRRSATWPGTSSLALVVLAAALLLAGCGLGDDMMATVGLPTSQTTPSSAQAYRQPNTLTVTSQQRGYLDALKATGVRPSSDLLALSIGSYVCQARAAKQNDQAVWDFVLPLVRSDVRDARPNSKTPTSAEIDAATADYIRIATERLC